MTLKISTRTIALIAVILLTGTISLRAQFVISSEKIAIKRKDRLMSISGADGNFVLIKESKSIRIIHYDTAFKTKAISAQALNQVLNKEELMGFTQIRHFLMILLSDINHEHFSILKYDIPTGRFSLGPNFDMDDFMYLNWFVHDDKLNIIALKKKTSLLSIVSFDSAGLSTQMKFDLSKENFKFSEQKASLYSILEDRPLRKFLPETYQNDFLTGALCKVFCLGNELFLTLNTRSAATQVIALDLDQKIYANYLIPYSRNNSKPGQECDGNSYLIDHRLVTAFVYPEGLSVGLYDLDSSRYLKQWGPGYESLDSFRGSPYLYENAINGKADTIDNSKTFQKKIFGMPRLSVSANQTSEGDLEIYIGGIEAETSSGGPGGMAVAGGGGMYGGGIIVTSMGSATKAHADDETAANVKKHYFFRSTLDKQTFSPKPASYESKVYEAYSQDLFMILHSELRKNAVQFNQGRKFYLGFYVPDQGVFCIARYK